jgi:hypothetical protein
MVILRLNFHTDGARVRLNLVISKANDSGQRIGGGGCSKFLRAYTLG